MDYFGRQISRQSASKIAVKFQSFWVNGLLWKQTGSGCGNMKSSVSILLGQWITLEAATTKTLIFRDIVSILLGQWITLEAQSFDGFSRC